MAIVRDSNPSETAAPAPPAVAGAFPARYRSPSAGFTLLEAMITISILAILMAIGIPSYRDFIASRAVTGQISDLAGTIRLARSEAIKRGIAVSICRTENPDADTPACAGNQGDWSSGWITFVDRDNDGAVDDDDFIIRVQPAYANSGGITRNAATQLSFQSNGVVRPAAMASFLIRPKLDSDLNSYATLSHCMFMNATGETRLVKGVEGSSC